MSNIDLLERNWNKVPVTTLTLSSLQQSAQTTSHLQGNL